MYDTSVAHAGARHVKREGKQFCSWVFSHGGDVMAVLPALT